MNDYRSRAYSRYNKDYTFEPPRLASSYDRRLTSIVRPQKHWSCLDIACGYGNLLAYLRAKGITEYIGIDTSADAVAVASKEFGTNRVQQADVFGYLASNRNSFDLISAIDFIEHVTKDEFYELLDMTFSALKPGGLILLRTPNANGLFGMAARYNDITHEVCFTPGSIADALSSGGFEIRAIWEDLGRPTSALQLMHWLAWKVVRVAIRCANAAETGSWGDGILTRNMWILACKKS